MTFVNSMAVCDDISNDETFSRSLNNCMTIQYNTIQYNILYFERVDT